jgi:hypothetical protein
VTARVRHNPTNSTTDDPQSNMKNCAGTHSLILRVMNARRAIDIALATVILSCAPFTPAAAQPADGVTGQEAYEIGVEADV